MSNLDIEPKSFRILTLCAKLLAGEIINKAEMARTFHVTGRSIQRDMETLRCFFAEQIPPREVVYEAKVHGYHLLPCSHVGNSDGEILAVCKILLESRSMVREEIAPILERLIACCATEQSRKIVHSLVANEEFHYIGPRHGRPVLKNLWEIGQAIQRQLVMEIEYESLDGTHAAKCAVEPVGLLFSEYYFYLAALERSAGKGPELKNPEERLPAIFRIDRIRTFRITEEHFKVSYTNRFKEGEFRKRMQLLYAEKNQGMRFEGIDMLGKMVLDGPVGPHEEWRGVQSWASPASSWAVTGEKDKMGMEEEDNTGGRPPIMQRGND